MTSIKVIPLADNLPFGVQITGVTWDNVKDAAVRKQITDAFDDRGMILFKDMEPTPEMQIELSSVFGPPQDHPLKEQPRVDAAKKLGVSDLNYEGTIIEADGKQLVSYVPWHFDACYTDKLNRGGILRPLIIPPEGGLTGFADGVQLYKDVSPALRAKFENLSVIYHSFNMFNNQRFGVPKNYRWISLSKAASNLLQASEKAPRAVHPAIWKRKTGESVLHVSPWQAAGIQEMPGPDGDALLEALCQEMTAKMKPYWHAWTPTDMVIWDNWRFIHAAGGNNPKYARHMQRTTIKGDYGLGIFEHGAKGEPASPDLMM
jgi:taurine dioxygenase